MKEIKTRSAVKDADVTFEIEALDRRCYSRLHIVGGGTQNALLNKLTAEYTEKDVWLCPIEATAVGNILVQMLGAGEFSDIYEARSSVMKSFNIEKLGCNGR
jgi:rhamnulokinase